MSQAQALKAGVLLTPFVINIEGQSYMDDFDLDRGLVLESVKEGSIYYSQPYVGDTIALFEKVLETYDYLIYFTSSQTLSGTYNAGLLARDEVSKERISIIDLKSGFGGYQWVLHHLNHLKGQYHSTKEMIASAQAFAYHSLTYLIMDEIESFCDYYPVSKLKQSLYQVFSKNLVLELNSNNELEKFVSRNNYDAMIHKVLLHTQQQGYTNENAVVYITCHKDNPYLVNIKQRLIETFGEIEIKVVELSASFLVLFGQNGLVLQFVNKSWK